MVEILLLRIACCLFFGADKTKEGIGCFLKVIAMIVIGFVLLNFIRAFLEPSTDEEKTTLTQEEFVYIPVTADELSDALENDVDSASTTYWNEHVSVTGRFDEINLIGELNNSFFYLSDIDDYSDIKQITCNIQSDEQYQRLEQFSENETITVKGIITNVDEYGYELDVDSID